MTYDDAFFLIESKNLIPQKHRGEIIPHDFRDLPNEELYQLLFEFFNSLLTRNDSFLIYPAIFFYNTGTTLNSIAISENNHHLISFNKGVNNFLIRNFYENNEILNVKELESYQKSATKSDWPINKLMFQCCNLFYFYHELGHLIQHSAKSNLTSEVSNQNTPFKLTDHLKEYDADLFASINVSAHLYQYIVKYCKRADLVECEKIISSIIASIFLTILSFHASKSDFYLKENTHPHPYIRLIACLHFITDHLGQLSIQNKHLQLDSDELLGRVFHVSLYIGSRIIDKIDLNKFQITFNENKKDILSYNEYLLKSVQTSDNLSFSKWNIRPNDQ
jgi:hypothetical protein